MSKLDKVFNNFLETFKEEQALEEGVVWEEEPVTYGEFVTSKQHMNFPPYSERQLDGMNYLFGNKPKESFNNGVSLAILQWGKGCLAPECFLEDAFTHEKFTIKELSENKKSIYINCYDELNKKSTIEKTSIPWISGSGEIYEVKTESGKTINVYKHHQFLTKNGWKKLSELKINDEILDDSIKDNNKEVDKVVNDFKERNKKYTDGDVKKYLHKLFPFSKIKDKNVKKYNNKMFYLCLYKIMGKEWRRKKFGSQKEKHPLWGKHHSKESIKKNRESNKITLNKIYNSSKGEEIRKKISSLLSGKNNPMYGKDAPIGSGKCKYYLFKNNKNEEFYLQGTWELKFASFLNDKNIYWVKNKDRFNYKNNKNEERTYCPDFKLFFKNEYIYVEIKGFEDENVERKIEAVRKTGNNIYIIREKIFKKYYLKYKTPILKFEKIKSIKYLRNDNYYDLEVDKYHNYLAHGLYNHNSGKDTICCHATLYCVYLLLCCKNPHKLFRGIDATSYMDIVNVAYNIQQARDVFFTKLVEAVKKWKWLREKYKFVESGKSKKLDQKYENEDVVNIKSDEIRFPKYVRALTKCSQQNAAEGLNVLLWILDEFSAFSDKNNKSNAMEMFNTLKSSSVTRFGNQSKGFVISFPRYKDDPIQKLSKMYEDDLSTYIDKASTFEVKPRNCFCDKWVEWKGREIPEDFLSEFTRDPENALAKYFCEPPEMSDPYFTEIDKIDACIDKNKKPLFEIRSNIVDVNGEKLYRNEIINQNYNLPNITFALGGDIGLTNDLSSISLWHSETNYLGNNESITYYIQDLKIDWIPNKAKGIKVDTENIEKIIDELIWKYKIPIINVFFDHFNTALLLQRLRNRGVNGLAYVLTVQDFYDIRTKIYDGRIKFLNEPEQILEIKRLKNTASGKPDHVEDGHDDRFRANCLAITALSGGGKNSIITSNDDGVFINKKLNPEENGVLGDDFEGEILKESLHSGGTKQSNLEDFESFIAGEL